MLVILHVLTVAMNKSDKRSQSLLGCDVYGLAHSLQHSDGTHLQHGYHSNPSPPKKVHQ